MRKEPACYRFHQIEEAMGNACIPVKQYQDAILFRHDHHCDFDDELPDNYDDIVDYIIDADYEILKHDDNLSMRDLENYKQVVIFCNRKAKQ